LGVLVLVAAATVLEANHRLSGGAWATVVLGLSLLAVASWCLPVITKLKIAGAEFTKEVEVKETLPALRLPRTPIQPNPTPTDFPTGRLQTQYREYPAA